MTARRRPRRRQAGAGYGFAVGAVVVVLLAVAVAHLLAVLVVLAVVGGAGYALGRRRIGPGGRGGPVVRAARSPQVGYRVGPWTAPGPPAGPDVSERDRQAAELAAVTADRDRLAADLAAARASAELAWDAAAERLPVPPRPDPPGSVARMLTDPLSGVRQLGPG